MPPVTWLPMAHFQEEGQPFSDDEPDDDEPLAETPRDVVMMLGFDPKDADFDEPGEV